MTVREPIAPAADQAFELFKRRILRLSGLDLNAYKHGQMLRRLTSLRKRFGDETWEGFSRTLEKSPAALQKFRDFVTINVSELFRNAEKFQQLQTDILPKLAARRAGLRVWSAGCSYGAEPYSLAMILDSAFPNQRHSITATDIDDTVLKRAAAGDGFLDADIRQVPQALRERYLVANGPDSWTIHADLKRMISFRRHDLLGDQFPEHLDLIVCRNVVIYFTDEAKSHIYRKFFAGLRPGGYLFVGGTEIIREARQIGFHTSLVSFYQRPAPEPRGNLGG